MSKRDAQSNSVAERMLIGALLRSAQDYWAVAGTVRADHFANSEHRELFTAIRDVCEAGRPLNDAILLARLPEEDADGGPMVARIAVLRENARDAGSASDYADAVAEAAANRKLVAIFERGVKAVRNGEKAASDIAAEAEASILDVMQIAAPKRPRRIGEVAKSVFASSKLARDGDFLPGFSTGLPSVDEILGLILPEDLGFILASQGDGKTSLATQIGMHAAFAGAHVLLIEKEMTDESIAAREVAFQSNVSVREIHEGAFDYSQLDDLRRAVDRLQEPNFFILDEKKLTVRQIYSHAVAMKRTVGLGMLIIDQLDKIKPEGRHRDRFERTAEITNDLKDMAKELKVPVLCLAQRTRSAQRRDDPTPDVNDSDAPTLERDADWVLATWRKENWLRKNRPSARASGEEKEKWEHAVAKARGIAEVICLKRRRGQAYEQRTLKWDGPRTRFLELE